MTLIIDAQLIFSDTQVLVASAASANIVDLGVKDQTAPYVERRLGTGEKLIVAVRAEVAPDHTTGDESYTVKLQTDDNPDFFSPTDLPTEFTIPNTAPVGPVAFIGIPPGVTVQRYLRATYTLGGTTPSITVSAWMLPASMLPVDDFVYYAIGYTIAE
jgi:hypothetical protein